MLTLFWILQPEPIVTCGPIITFWPIEQFRPIVLPASTWQKCQMTVPSPIAAGSST